MENPLQLGLAVAWLVMCLLAQQGGYLGKALLSCALEHGKDLGKLDKVGKALQIGEQHEHMLEGGTPALTAVTFALLL